MDRSPKSPQNVSITRFPSLSNKNSPLKSLAPILKLKQKAKRLRPTITVNKSNLVKFQEYKTRLSTLHSLRQHT